MEGSPRQQAPLTDAPSEVRSNRRAGTLGGVADCALEATLKSLLDTAPIRLSPTNRSGANLLPVTFGRKVSAAVESGIQPRIPFSLTTN